MDNLKKEILNSLKNTYCRLKPSQINGVGVFAIRDIPKNINPFKNVKKQKWLKFNTSELKSLPKEILNLIDDFFVINNDSMVYISESGLHGMDVSYFLNNSKKPSMQTIDDGKTFVAKRDIKKGEELTVSYATYDEKYT